MAKKASPTSMKTKRSRFAFIGDIIGELRKVKWPTRRETVRLTAMVLVVCIFMGMLLGGIDYGFAELVAKVFLRGG